MKKAAGVLVLLVIGLVIVLGYKLVVRMGFSAAGRAGQAWHDTHPPIAVQARWPLFLLPLSASS